MIEIIAVDKAVGLPLAHDITEIRPGEFKGAAFPRGHILQCEEVEHLRRLGKNHLYVLRPEAYEMHEDDAAEAIATALCGDGVGWDNPPREGKITLKAQYDGLFKVDVEALTRFNEIGDVMCATRHTNSYVKKGQKVGATRSIPLLIAKDHVKKAIEVCGESDSVLKVLPIKSVNVGLLIVGTEVYEGRIKDRFEPIIRKKVEAFGGRILDVVFLPDDKDRIAKEALNLVNRGVDILFTTGGMSVDADDVTRPAIEQAGGKDILYGSAVLPGAMFMTGLLEGVPFLGIPACGMYAKATVLDLVYPRILAGERITRRDVARLGHGGYCLKCKHCQFPDCAFGKSV